MSEDATAQTLSAERASIGRDVQQIVSAIITAPRPPNMAPDRVPAWEVNWLIACLLGYCQTDLGVAHASGEDGSGWREDAARHGFGVPPPRGPR